MDLIYACAIKFVAIKQCEYRFVVSKNRKTQELILNFSNSDFFHLAGLQHLTDINIPRNRKDILKNILIKNKITDSMLNKSRFYTHAEHNIKSRITLLCFLEQYLDTDNLISIYNTKKMRYLNTNIKADYLIESKLKNTKDTVYMFIRKRKEQPNTYCIVSFFKKNDITYGGDALYWMIKEKIYPNTRITLYKHPDYIEK